jgi:hypothetical protein
MRRAASSYIPRLLLPIHTMQDLQVSERHKHNGTHDTLAMTEEVPQRWDLISVMENTECQAYGTPSLSHHPVTGSHPQGCTSYLLPC